MKTFILSCVLLFIACAITEGSPAKQANPVTLTAEEVKLYDLVTAYRSKNGLGQIPLSVSLTLVAHLHVHDLEDNHPDIGRCNMHSWSGKGKWKACCYTANQAQAQCMWNKPRELTSYPGDGFEIAAGGSGTIDVNEALKLWKGSQPHNDVILNKDIWKEKWSAIGIGIYKKYAVVWFGNDVDKSGGPGKPK